MIALNIDCVAQQYEDLAQEWATRIDMPFDTTGIPFELSLQLIDALWTCVYPEVIESIEIDPHAFADRVAVYRLALHSEEVAP